MNEDFEFVFWFQVMGCWSMFPLLKKDQLALPYFLWQVIFISMMMVLQIFRKYTSFLGNDSKRSGRSEGKFLSISLSTWKSSFYNLSAIGKKLSPS
jgi:hypothetical protein